MQDSSRPATGYPFSYPTQAQAQAQTRPANGYPPPPYATAYPYQNPYQGPPPLNPRATLLRRLLVFVIALAIILGAIFLIIFLALRPRLPRFYVNSLSVSNFNASSNRLSGNWDLQLLVVNPNKKLTLTYIQLDSAVYYGDEYLTQTSIQPFFQGTKDQTTVNATLTVAGTYTGTRLVDGINKERTRGRVEFDVRIASWVGYKYKGWTGRRRVLGFDCRNLPVGISSNSTSGKFIGELSRCAVR